jgi:hypothetical protein
MSRAKAYRLIAEGDGPATVQIGATQFVTEEADRKWRRRLQPTETNPAA